MILLNSVRFGDHARAVVVFNFAEINKRSCAGGKNRSRTGGETRFGFPSRPRPKRALRFRALRPGNWGHYQTEVLYSSRKTRCWIYHNRTDGRLFSLFVSILHPDGLPRTKLNGNVRFFFVFIIVVVGASDTRVW